MRKVEKITLRNLSLSTLNNILVNIYNETAKQVRSLAIKTLKKLGSCYYESMTNELRFKSDVVKKIIKHNVDMRLVDDITLKSEYSLNYVAKIIHQRRTLIKEIKIRNHMIDELIETIGWKIFPIKFSSADEQ